MNGLLSSSFHAWFDGCLGKHSGDVAIFLSYCQTESPAHCERGFLFGSIALKEILYVNPGAPTEIRTLVLALKGLRPGPLDDGGMWFCFLQRAGFYQSILEWSSVFWD